MRRWPNRSHRSEVGICILFTALVWIVFGQTLRHEFVNFDDNKYVYENAQVSRGLSFRGIAWAFTHVHSENWHPLTTISHMVDCQVYGLKAGGHHLTNIVLHTVSVALLFLVLQQMSGGPSSPRDESVSRKLSGPDRTGSFWRSAFVAAVFAIHPLRVESVAWIAERKDVLSGIFFMLTLGAYLRYARAPSVSRYVTMSILFACGLMSKATLVTVPFVLFLLDYWPLRRATEFRAWRRLIIEKVPLLALSAASSAATIFAQRPTISSLAGLPIMWRINNAVISAVIYLWQLFWPTNLAVFYPHPRDQQSGLLVLVAALVIITMSVLAVFVREKRPYITVGWFWYLGMLVPVLGVVQAGLQGHADRFTYLPHIGILILLAWGIADLTKSWRYRELILGLGAATATIALVACSYRQTAYWHDSVSLWSHTLMVTSNNDTAHLCMAEALLERGKVDEAIAHSQAAVDIRPENAGAYGRVPVVLTDEQTRSAIAYWKNLLKTYPSDVNAHNNLGVILFQSGNPRGAIAEWETSLTIQPNDGNAQNNLAWALATCPDQTIRDARRAVELAQRAVKLPGGETPIVLRTLAAAYAEKGEFSKAVETAQRASDSAAAQQNPSLVETLRHEIALYRANTPYREVPPRD